jgi:hypothetical protein
MDGVSVVEFTSGRAMMLTIRIAIYLGSVAVGAVVAVWTIGTCLQLQTTVDGFGIASMSVERTVETLQKNPDALRQRTVLVLGGRSIAAVEGNWPVFAVLIGIPAALLTGTHLLWKYMAARRGRRRQQ